MYKSIKRSVVSLLFLFSIGLITTIVGFALANSSSGNTNQLNSTVYASDYELASELRVAQNGVKTIVKIDGKDTFNDFPDFMNSLVKQAIPIASALAVLMFIYAGFKYVMSAGDASAINEAKSIFASTLTGVILLLLISVIYYIVIQRWS